MKNKNNAVLRNLIRKLVKEEIYAGSYPDENYDKKLNDDPAFNAKSVYVSDEVKSAIKKWLKTMKLD